MNLISKTAYIRYFNIQYSPVSGIETVIFNASNLPLYDEISKTRADRLFKLVKKNRMFRKETPCFIKIYCRISIIFSNSFQKIMEYFQSLCKN